MFYAFGSHSLIWPASHTTTPNMPTALSLPRLLLLPFLYCGMIIPPLVSVTTRLKGSLRDMTVIVVQNSLPLAQQQAKVL